MPLALLVVGMAAVAAFLLDRLLLAAEARGWIYYRKRTPSQSSVGSAFLEVHSQLEPDKRHVLEVRREGRVEEDDEAGPDDPSRPRRAKPDRAP